MTKTKEPVLANRYIKVSRSTKDDEGKTTLETVDLVPGQEVPDWAVDQIKPEHLGDPRDPLEEEADQFLVALRETATREGINWTPEWRKEHLSQAITGVRQAANSGKPIDMRQFGPIGSVEPAEQAENTPEGAPGDKLKSLDDMSRDELNAEYEKRFDEKPHHALADSTLRSRLADARDRG